MVLSPTVTLKLPRDSKKIRSKLNDPDTSVEEISRKMVIKKILEDMRRRNSSTRKFEDSEVVSLHMCNQLGCFKRGHIGHISKYCEICLCGLEKKYINYSGPHNTTDRVCPVLKKHMEIARVMLLITFLFLEARLLVEKNINLLFCRFIYNLISARQVWCRYGEIKEVFWLFKGLPQCTEPYVIDLLDLFRFEFREK
ncbi:hypothetical protein ALC53_05870 [Atta colombica]|uniref:Uncharacterized protein n=1 Tax=Atta colombica TaxID=520822 RepID=A0A151I3K3_9HYME|nr:hypothetical protein ALC53_05870 [Atta colombica]